jgi:hypothetical protein
MRLIAKGFIPTLDWYHWSFSFFAVFGNAVIQNMIPKPCRIFGLCDCGLGMFYIGFPKLVQK